MAVTVTIGGVDKTVSVLVQGCSIDQRLGGRDTLRLSVIEKSASPTCRPAMLAEVTVADGSTLFGGVITGVSETPIIEPQSGILSRLSAVDYSLYASRVIVNEVYAADRADKSIKAIITDLRTTYLDQYGITLDAGMLTGPDITGEVVFAYATCAEALDHVCALAGWIWYIDAAKVLKAHVPRGAATPATLTTSNCRLVSWQR